MGDVMVAAIEASPRGVSLAGAGGVPAGLVEKSPNACVLALQRLLDSRALPRVCAAHGRTPGRSARGFDPGRPRAVGQRRPGSGRRLALRLAAQTGEGRAHIQGVFLVLTLCTGLFAVLDVADASEQSDRLVAQGEREYQAGRYPEALARFERAAAADPGDATAQYAVGLALGKLGRWAPAIAAFERALAIDPDFADAQSGLDLARINFRAASGPEALATEPAGEIPTVVEGEGEPAQAAGIAPRRWSVYAGTGWEYDSNPQILPGGDAVPGVEKEGDNALIVVSGGRYDAINTQQALLRFEYDFYDTLYLNLSDFDFQSHRLRATAGRALLPWLWAGAQGGYNYYLLGPQSYLNEPFVTPFASFIERTWGLTQAYFRYAEDTYLSTPFHEVRDGPTYTTGVNQTLYDGPRYLAVGYEFGAEIPRSSAGNDYDQRANQWYVGVGVPLPWRINLDLTYLFRYENYLKPNSQANFTKRRHDAVNYLYATLGRSVTEHISVALAYYGTFDHSNIPVYEYDRNIVSASVQFTY